MTERPISFSAAMVRAILAGRKTQTRRVLKPRWLGPPVKLATHGVSPEPCSGAMNDPASWGWPAAEDGADAPMSVWPEWWGYRVGDTLWVREAGAWRDGAVAYAATDTKPAGERWRSYIHMPRWAARITLRVTNVRVQRLQEISEADARAEGAERMLMDDDGAFYQSESGTFRTGFAGIWAHIHGPGAWDANPWVVAISFIREPSSHA